MAKHETLNLINDFLNDKKNVKNFINFIKNAEEMLNGMFENLKPLAHKIVEIIANANKNSESKLHYDVIIDNPKLLMKDLSNGADPDIQRKSDGLTPLHLAAFTGKKDLVELLLKYKADPNIVSYKDHYTALHAASICQNQEDAFEVAKLLVRYGARADLIDEQGNKAYDYALKNNKNIATLLKDTEASQNIWNGYHKVIKSEELPGVDIVELRHALNNNQFDVVYKLSEESHIDYHEVADWAKYHNYEDKVGSILSMCEHTHHHEL
ncbi:serine/threonine protein kinase [endosymbiont of Acanthamoeba sp. UWC8]|uniref:ankyrin repeat domain-containing protein n=1 Tax=endosymbiont of Acanthamoeba sp. UWC8 TaxID=86106 RepID=UPI0004D1E832|nr:ankyrin repeat domain-containing protein [endosymbiont of Acanthamoeba sp. UWC8]AIF81221.1 serine/threonine protein kinase [endosymbiont of Acanthamoeba sp. UWC8]